MSGEGRVADVNVRDQFAHNEITPGTRERLRQTHADKKAVGRSDFPGKPRVLESQACLPAARIPGVSAPDRMLYINIANT
jgi:hypothetical protein